jgi:hypothetical protein
MNLPLHPSSSLLVDSRRRGFDDAPASRVQLWARRQMAELTLLSTKAGGMEVARAEHIEAVEVHSS